MVILGTSLVDFSGYYSVVVVGISSVCFTGSVFALRRSLLCSGGSLLCSEFSFVTLDDSYLIVDCSAFLIFGYSYIAYFFLIRSLSSLIICSMSFFCSSG